MRIFTFLLVIIGLFTSELGWGQSIFTNPITGTNPNTDNPYTNGQTVNSNISASGIGRGSGISGANANNRYNANGWSTGAIDLNDYFEFTITPNSGYKIDFVSFVYTGQVSTGTPNFAFRSSLDGFTADIGSPNITGTTISLSGASFQGITSAITFRYYGFNFAASGTTYSINDFTFNGTVSSSCTPPTTGPSGFSTSNIMNTSMDVNWSGNGNGDNVLVVARSGGAVNADPASGTSYTANAAFGSGSQIGTGNYVVYKGSGSTVNVTSLMAGTTYHYAIYAFNSADNCYNTANKLIGNAMTTTPPPVITHTGTSPAASNVNQGSTNNVLYSIKVDVATTATTLNNLVATTGGDWANGDVSNFKLWFSTDATFGSDTEIKSVTNPSPGDITFSSFTQDFPIGTRYLFITCDIAAAGTINKTVSAFVDANSDMTYNNSPTFSGSTFAAGNPKTIIGVTELQMQYPVGTDVACGFTVAFGNVVVNQNSSLTFRIKNIGTGDLNLTTLPLTIGGTNANQFSITTQPTSPIAPGNFQDVVVQFTPTSTGAKTANISIANSDSDENPCVVNLSGTGVLANDNCSGAISLTLSSNETCTPTSGTSTGGTQSIAAITCNSLTGNSDDDVWYSFVATATSHIITVDGAANMDAVIDLRSGACDGTNIDCADLTGSDGIETFTETGMTIGNTYYIRVYDYASGGGDFTICVTTPEPPKWFRTTGSGNFSSASIWETSPDGNDPWTAATAAPKSTDLNVNFRPGHTVTINTATTLDQATIEAGSTLEVSSATLTVANGTGTDLNVNGILKNTLGTITTTGTIAVNSGGKYQHNYTSGAGVIPTATWNSGSICEILAMTVSASTPSLGQDFWHFIWNQPTQTVNMNLFASLKSIKGDFTIASTGSGDIRLVAGISYTGLNIDGNFIMQNGSDLVLTSGATAAPVTIKGNIDICSTCTISESGTGDGSITLNGSSQQTINGNGAAMSGTIPVTLNNAGGAVLLSNFKISDNLILTNGQIRTNGNVLEMSTNSTTITSSTTNFICTCSADGNTTSTTGGLSRRVLPSTTVLFPVGPLSNLYMPASVIAQSGHAIDFFTVRTEPLQSNGVSVPDPTKCIQYQWIVDETTAGGSSAKLKFQWANGTTGSNFNPAVQPEIGRWSGTTFNPISVATYAAGDPSFTSASNFTAFSPFVVASGGALPVELSYFTATPLKNKVNLNWATASEQNNDRFEIERSADADRFDQIGSVKGAGTSFLTNTYSFVDELPLSGTSYYRLKQVDHDGAFEYSPVRTVVIGTTHDISIIPTVTSSSFRIEFGESLKTEATINLISVGTGQSVYQMNVPSDTDSQIIPVDNLPSGTYFVRIQNGQEVVSKMFVKVD